MHTKEDIDKLAADFERCQKVNGMKMETIQKNRNISFDMIGSFPYVTLLC